MNAVKYKAELALVKAQSIDVTNFETELESFKSAFGKNYDLATKLPADLVAEMAKASTQSQEAWKHAREKSGTCKR